MLVRTVGVFTVVLCAQEMMVKLEVKNQHDVEVKSQVEESIDRLHEADRQGISAINLSVQLQVELCTNDRREDILEFSQELLNAPSLLPRVDTDASHAVICSLLEDAGKVVPLAQAKQMFRSEHDLPPTELQVIALRYVITGYWRQSQFADAAEAFDLLAKLLDRRPSRRGTWHLCIVVATICNDERQHNLARRFSMQALNYAWSLEDSRLIQRAQYDHANSLSLAVEDQLAADGFAELRALMESGRSVVDQITHLSVWIGSARDFIRIGEISKAERCLALVEERSSQLNSNGWYLYLAAQVLLAHHKDQTLIRDSKLEEIHCMQMHSPSRLGEQARSHVCFHIAGKSRSYRAMEGGRNLLPSEIKYSLNAINNRCRESLQRLEQIPVKAIP